MSEVTEKGTMLSIVKAIYERLQNGEISLKNTKKSEKDLDKICKFVNIKDHRQGLIFCVCFYLELSGNTPSLDSMSRSFKTDIIDLMSYYPEIEKLLENKIFIPNSGGYRRRNVKQTKIPKCMNVREDIIDAVIKNDSSQIIKPININTFEDAIIWFDQLVSDREDNEISEEEFMREVNAKVKDKKGLDVFKKLKSLDLNKEETIILLGMILTASKEGPEGTLEVGRFCENIFGGAATRFRITRLIAGNSSVLFSKNLIEMEKANFRGDMILKLTDAGFEMFIGKDMMLEKTTNFKPILCDLIESENINSMEMFYNEEDKKQISNAYNFVQEEKFQMIRERLEKHQMKPNLTMLFFGHPGTGKTETAYQLAKSSGRNILMVDISKIRRAWVGESEKNIKRVFEEYKKACAYYEKTPILLFNESDALISKRISVQSSVDQMQNNMQNILLQALEDFQGIFVATSNLLNNLDPAFERRFLYKLYFSKPDEEVRREIWKSKIPDISDENATVLSKKYDISGAQIQNIAKKLLLQDILFSEEINIESLERLASEETSFKRDKHRKKMGFEIDKN